MYFVTDKYFGKETELEPRVPSNYFTRQGYENSKTPRICLANSIDDCLIGLAKNISGQVLNVYRPVGEFSVKIPTEEECPGTSLYNEFWITSKCKFIYDQTIIVGFSREKPMYYTYIDKNGESRKAALYKWNWIPK